MGRWDPCPSTFASGCVYAGAAITEEADTQEETVHTKAAPPYAVMFLEL